MTFGLGTIITMASITVGSAVTQVVLRSMGKMDESQILDFTTKSGLIVIAITVFVTAMKAVSTLI